MPGIISDFDTIPTDRKSLPGRGKAKPCAMSSFSLMERLTAIAIIAILVCMPAYFREKMLDREKPYMVSLYSAHHGRARDKAISEAEADGHGREFNTSVMMAEGPELFRGQPADYGMPLIKRSFFPQDRRDYTGPWRYADYPRTPCADRPICSAEKGERFLMQQMEGLIDRSDPPGQTG